MNEKEILSAAGRIMGARTSAKKARSSRRNGKLAWSKKRKLTDSKRDAKPNGHRKLNKNKSVASV